MHPISPAVLTEAASLSRGALALVALVGVLLWGAGWRLHQFWVVFGVTLAAGTLGLSAGPTAGGPRVLILGVLMAVAAGLLALELAKLASFASGGAAAWAAAHAVFPQAQELWAVFLLGGILGAALFRLWAMLATSAAGALCLGHAALALLNRPDKFDAAAWAGRHGEALAGAVALLTVLGVVVQAKLTAPADAATGPPAPAEEPAHDDEHADDPHARRPAPVGSGRTPAVARHAGRSGG